MRVALLQLLIIFLLPITLSAQYYPWLKEQIFFGGKGDEYGHRLVIDEAKGDYFIVGAISGHNGFRDGYITKFDVNDNLIYDKKVGGQYHDELYDAELTKEGELVYCGVSGEPFSHGEVTFPEGYADYLVGKLDHRGHGAWQHRLGGTQQDIAYGVAATDFGGLIVTGSSWSKDIDAEGNNEDHALNNQWISIINRNGRVLRYIGHGGKKNDWGRSVCRTRDNGYVLAGVTNSEDLDDSKYKHNGDVWLTKVNFAGAIQWSNVIKAPGEDLVYRIVANPFGLYYVVGSRVTKEKGKQFWLAKLDDRGNVLWEKLYGESGFEELRSICVLKDGGVAMVGFSKYRDIETPGTKGRKDVWVLRTNPQGELIWKKSFGGPNEEIGVDIAEYKEGLLYVLCQKENHFNGKKESMGQDFWLLKIEERPCKTAEPTIFSDIRDYREKAGVPIKFLNASRMKDAQFYWDFGDGTSSTEKQPVKKYMKTGVYNVSLTITVNEGCRTKLYYPKPVIITR